MGMDDSMRLFVLDVADPDDPALLFSTAVDVWPFAGIAVNGTHAYVASYGRGLLVYDIANPAAPVLQGGYRDSLFWDCREVAVSGKYALVGWGQFGLRVIDVSNPASPTLYGWYQPDICSYRRVAVGNGCAYVCDPDVCNFNIIRVAALTMPGWESRADVPAGPKGKRVKDGGCLAYKPDSTGEYVYALKGNGTCEFNRYNITTNSWAAKESIPVVGSSGKKKAVKKGAALAAVPIVCADDADRLYPWAVKGNGTLEFWRYDPRLSGTPTYPWRQFADVPSGAKAIKEGAGMVRVVSHDSAFVYLLKGSGTQEFYRHDITTDNWTRMADAPLGASGKAYKNGSCLASDGTTIWALKGSYNELFAYDVAANTWSTGTLLPLTGSSGKKKKVKDGAGIAWLNGSLFALKGGGTRELWNYSASAKTWAQLPDMPPGAGKPVKGGGGLTAASDALFALKGNNTLEFYTYTPAGYGSLLMASSPSTQGSIRPQVTGFKLDAVPTILRNPQSALRISYTLPRAGAFSLKLYDITGRVVNTLATGRQNAGDYSLVLNSRQLASGLYVLKLSTGNATLTRKLIVEL
jgi:N-acetylneuraminic acid mutarotase